jgi:hypothetical protein
MASGNGMSGLNHSLVWISERQAVNPASIVWIFRGTHGELEITFSAGKHLLLNERDLSASGRALLLPPDEAVRPISVPLNERVGPLARE